MKQNYPQKTSTEMETESNIIHLVEQAAAKVAAAAHRVYDNKGVMELLHIKDKLLKKLRDDGLLGYSRYGDKYWYTQEDVDKFLLRFHYADFSKQSSLPASFVEGGRA